MLRIYREKNHKAAVRKANHQSWPATPTTNTSLLMEFAMTGVRIGISLPKRHMILTTEFILEDVPITLTIHYIARRSIYLEDGAPRSV